MPEQSKNFAVSTVATAPSPATSGTSLVVGSGHGARFPTAPFNAIVAPVGDEPTPDNAEVVRVTGVSTDTLTITRAQESSTARSVVVGDRIWAGPTAKTFADVLKPPVMCLTKAALQSIGNAGFGTTIDLDTTAEDVDPGTIGAFTAVLASDYLRVNLASYVLVDCLITYANNATGVRACLLNHLDSSGSLKKGYGPTQTQSIQGNTIHFTQLLLCAVNDRLNLTGFQTSGGSLNTGGGGVDNQHLRTVLVALV